MGFNEGTSFAKGLRYDDGTRSLAPSVAEKTADGSTPQELQNFGQDLSGVWDVKPKTIGANFLLLGVMVKGSWQ
jgi:hypothetical protein